MDQLKNMSTFKSLKKDIFQASGLSLLVCIIMCFLGRNTVSVQNLIIQGIFGFIFFFLFFTIGTEKVSEFLRVLNNKRPKSVIIIPLLLALLVYGYALLEDGNPFQGTGLILPLFLMFEVLIFVKYLKSEKAN